jgi:hypothetical protein
VASFTDGKGQYIYLDGDLYVGEWKDGKQCGEVFLQNKQTKKKIKKSKIKKTNLFCRVNYNILTIIVTGVHGKTVYHMDMYVVALNSKVLLLAIFSILYFLLPFITFYYIHIYIDQGVYTSKITEKDGTWSAGKVYHL